jgi:ABC-type uncharacterized transport system permease subunit
MKIQIKRKVLQTAAPIVCILALTWIITACVSDEPGVAMKYLLTGPVSRINRFGNWIEQVITLIFTGLAVSIVFNANQFSMGAEGQIFVGALAAALVGLSLPALPGILHIPLALLAAAGSGFAWGAIPGYLKARFRANEVVSSLMLNSIAIQLYDYVLIYHLKPPTAGYPVSKYLPSSAVLPNLIPRTRVSISLIIGIGCVWLVYTLVYKSTMGYEIRMVGHNPKFARCSGINVGRTIVMSTALSGALAGLAGACLVMGVHRRLIMGISPGYGFDGILVSLLAGNNPAKVPFAALFYGYLRTGADLMESNSDVARELITIIQAVAIMFITAKSLIPSKARREGNETA